MVRTFHFHSIYPINFIFFPVGEGVPYESFNQLAVWNYTSKAESPIYVHHGRTLASLVEISGSVEVASRLQSSFDTFVKVMNRSTKQSCMVLRLENPLSVGTTVILKSIFDSLPVRRKAMNYVQEMNYIKEFAQAMSILHHEISWKVNQVGGNQVIIQSREQPSVFKRISTLFGIHTLAKMIEVSYSNENFRIDGFLSPPLHSSCTWNKATQYIFYNDRWVKGSEPISSFINYHFTKFLHNTAENTPNTMHANFTNLQSQKYPFFILRISYRKELVEFLPDVEGFTSYFQDKLQIGKFLQQFIQNTFADLYPEFASSLGSMNPSNCKLAVPPSTKYFSKVYPSSVPQELNSRETSSLFNFAFFSKPQTSQSNAPVSMKEIQFGISIQRHSLYETEDSEIAIAKPEDDSDLKINLILERNGITPDHGIIVDQKVSLEKGNFSNLIVIGQWDCKYIVAKDRVSNLIYIFDQHAVDERINYEKFLSNVEDAIKTYQLDIPETLRISEKECVIFRDKMHLFQYWGFIYAIPALLDPDGLYSLEINTVPAVFDEILTVDDLLEFAHYISTNLNVSQSLLQPPAIRRILSYKACRASIKFGEYLSISKCQQLLQDLSATETPFQCAHGRPSGLPLLNLQNCVSLKEKERGRKQRLNFDNLKNIELE